MSENDAAEAAYVVEQGPSKDGRNPDGTFAKGNNANPAGKPKGTRHKTTLAVEALLDGEAETITRKAIELAIAGELTAIRVCLDRIVPPRRDRTVAFELPRMDLIALKSLQICLTIFPIAPDG